ncbi:hypothetical protein HY933_02825 [Candidatus Falkowbacteria bacterium]|nr:hypothetical protein [Candidatus Falkowbacteria bacterium]
MRPIKPFFLEQQRLWSLILFLLVFSFFISLQSAPRFLDPDSFYHAKMVQLIMADGPVVDFPWLPLTTLNQNYIDQHFLYHILLIPFVWLFGPLAGLKFAAALFAGIFVVGLAWLIRATVRQAQPLVPLLFAAFLLFCQPLLFRLNLAKAPALSLTFLLLGIFFVTQRRYWWLAVFSAAYVYLYGGWAVILVVLFFYLLGSGLSELVQKHKNIKTREQENIFLFLCSRVLVFIKVLLSPDSVKLVGSCIVGLSFGLVVNPYFPRNLLFYWQQLVQIGIVNYQEVVRVGSEWYGYGLQRLLLDTAPLSMLLIVALTVFVFTIRRQSRLTWTGLLLTIFFGAITLKSQRYVEYYIPAAILFSAWSLGPYLGARACREYWRIFVSYYNRQTILVTLLLVFWLMALTALASYDLARLWRDYRYGGSSFGRLAASSQWLAANVPAGQIIFHSDWDEFPQLLYHNSSNVYIAGLDPTFLYLASPARYQEYADITLGNDQTDLAGKISRDFGAEYIFVEIRGHDKFLTNLGAAADIYPVYSDDEAKVFRILKAQ